MVAIPAEVRFMLRLTLGRLRSKKPLERAGTERLGHSNHGAPAAQHRVVGRQDLRKRLRPKWLALLLMVIAACMTPTNPPERWSSVEDVCAPVLISLVPSAGALGAPEYYYISVDGQDPSSAYLAHLTAVARSVRRSENMRKRSQLKIDQAGHPRRRAVNVSCGGLRWETTDRARVSGSGLIVPLPGEIAVGGHGSVFILERRHGGWVIVGSEGFWTS